MIVSWAPVIGVDVIGSFLTLIAACVCAYLSWDWKKKGPDDIFRDYIFLLTLAFVFFAVSRSFGHLVKQYLIFIDLYGVWQRIAPFSGAVNSASFIVIFAFGIYFQRFEKVHLELSEYKDNLEKLVGERTRELEQENREREKAQHELRESNATLENIFNSALPMCITSNDFDLIEANEAYTNIWPVSPKGEKPMKCFDSRPGSLCHTTACPMTLVLEGMEEVTCETFRPGRDTNGKTYLQTTRPFRDADGNIVGTVTSFQDITERKRAIEELAAERERLAVTLRSIGDGVITTNTEGRIVMMNKVAEQLCGWSQQEAVDRPLHEIFRIVNEKTGRPCPNPVDLVMKTGSIVALENHTLLIARDGARISIADSGAPIRDTASSIKGVVLVFRDVTEKQRIEQELIKTQKLESVGILAGGIAHDFNNILAAILGNIDLAIHRLGENERVAPLLVEAEKASLRAKGLTQQLLTFAKGGSPVRRTVSIEGIIRDSALFILRGSGISCETDFQEDLWLVDIDPGQMSQVIQNIILNAREAMPDGGNVRISCRNSPEPAGEPTSDRDFVRITIADNGPGLDRAVMDKLFDPYFTTKNKGTGLGLSICHSIITQHGGTLTASSPPGSGAVFTILLPASRSSEIAHDQEISLPDFAGTPARILVMDDEEMVSKVAREMLQQLGHEVVLVKDGQEAIDCYRQALDQGKRFDLVIMDLTIPGGMGGKEAVGHIRTLDKEARVLVASGYSNDPVMSSYRDYGFCGSVIKPFMLRELAVSVQNALVNT
ncbi:MAG: PAS domain S-box protein [Desulfobulbaceae bacterium]|nr:PAS domain S-box protein [Desulfobulbaceae bacterium]